MVAATRQFARDIGTQFGFGWGNGTTAVGGAPAVGNSPTTWWSNAGLHHGVGTALADYDSVVLEPGRQPDRPAASSFINASNNMRIDAILSTAESRGLLKILSRPRVVTQNNIQALVKQGVHVPIVTAGPVGWSSYRDVRGRLPPADGHSADHVGRNDLPERGRGEHARPTSAIHQRQPDPDHAAGDNAGSGDRRRHGGDWRRDPDATTRSTFRRCRLLGNIPILGNLFKHRSVQTTNQELIFFITPRIIQT